MQRYHIFVKKAKKTGAKPEPLTAICNTLFRINHVNRRKSCKCSSGNWFNTDHEKNLCVFCCLLSAAGCLFAAESRSSNTIKIGAFLSLTGATSAYGISASNAIKLATDETNRNGGIDGKQIELEIEDDQSNTQEVPGIVNHLIKEHKVHALIAEPVSTEAMMAAPIAQQNQIVMISSASVKPELTMQGDYIFRACFISSTEGEAIAKFAVDQLKAKKVAIILDDKNDYAVVLAGFFADSFKKRGGQIVSEQKYEANATDLSCADERDQNCGAGHRFRARLLYDRAARRT